MDTERIDISDLLKGFNVHPKLGDCATSPDGGEYVELAGGDVFDGYASKSWSSVKDEAVDRFRLKFSEYLGKPPAVIYWRIKPELTHWPAYSGPDLNVRQRGGDCRPGTTGWIETPEKWCVYTRLRIGRG